MIKVNKCGINLYDTLTSGQCFRATLESDGSFTIVLKDRVVNVKENGEYLTVESNNENNLEEVITCYLDLNGDYDKINQEITRNNKDFIDVVNKCSGYRVLKQDELEMFISYIISQNNNVKRISKSIELLSKLYGKEVVFNKKKYYLFPDKEVIEKLTIEDLEPLKIGFRDKYIMNAINIIKEEKDFLEKLKYLKTDDALEQLMKIKGIGLKVASCILLFGYGRNDTFPVDTWVKKYVSENYGINDDIKTIRNLMLQKFKSYTGLCIQYMYHFNRNK